MGVEIEYKFLVALEDWLAHKEEVLASMPRKDSSFISKMTQAYIASSPRCIARVRIHDSAKAYLCVKNEKLFNRMEFEYEIPVKDATEMMALSPYAAVEKIRYYFRDGKVTWEIDEYLGDNEGLITAEVEVDAEEDVVEPLEWFSLDVTYDGRYSNYRLAKTPYAFWSD